MSAQPATPASDEHDRLRPTAWRNAVFVIFGACGVVMATWLSRNPAIRDLLGASSSQMGMIVLGLSIGSVAGLVLANRIISTFGPKRVIRGCFTGIAIGLVLAGLAATFVGSLPAVAAGLTAFGLGFGLCDVAMNINGAAAERALGRSVMPLFHAAFSIGTMVGAGIGALAEKADVPVAVHTGVVAVLVLIAVHIAIRYLPADADASSDETTATETSDAAPRQSVWRQPQTILIGLIVLGMAFAEGSANDWLPLAAVDGHGVENATGALLLGLFLGSMTVGRIFGVRILDRFGRVPVLQGSAALAAIGLLIFIFVPQPAVAAVGIVLWGLGSALGFPVGMSAAADDPATATARVSAVAIIGYFAFLVGPPVIGFVGEAVGLLHALLFVLVMVVAAGLASNAARERKP